MDSIKLISYCVDRIASNMGFRPTNPKLKSFLTKETIGIEIGDGQAKRKKFYPTVGMQIVTSKVRILGVEFDKEIAFVIQADTAAPYGFLLDRGDEAPAGEHFLWSFDKWIKSDVQTTALALYGSEIVVNQGMPFIKYDGVDLMPYLVKL